MQFRLRTLLIVLAVGPPVVAVPLRAEDPFTTFGNNDIVYFNSPINTGDLKVGRASCATLRDVLNATRAGSWDDLKSDLAALDRLANWLSTAQPQESVPASTEVVVVGRFPRYPDSDMTWVPVSLEDWDFLKDRAKVSYFVRLRVTHNRSEYCVGPLHCAARITTPAKPEASGTVSFSIMPLEDLAFRIFKK